MEKSSILGDAKFCIDFLGSLELLIKSVEGGKVPELQKSLEALHSRVLQPSYSLDPTDLDTLSRAALHPAYTDAVLEKFYSLYCDITGRWLSKVMTDAFDVAVAFGRVLPLIPHIASHADDFFEENRNFFDNIDSDPDDNRVLQRLVALYRILSFDLRRYGHLVVTQSILQLILDSNHSRSARFMALQVWKLHMNLSEALFNTLFFQYIESPEEPIEGLYDDQQIDYLLFHILEATRLANMKKKITISENRILSRQSCITIDNSCLNPRVANLCGVLAPRYKVTSHIDSKIVYTPTTCRNILSIARYIRTSSPLLITGAPGCGKTFLIDHLVSSLGYEQASIVRLHLGDQTDTKLLVGTYSTGEVPGSFVWKQGILANAVQRGYVVVVEDIDRAPNEVISVLLQLVQKRQIDIPSRGEVIKAHYRFLIIATTTEYSNSPQKDFIGRSLWQHARLAMMTDEELEQVIVVQYPRIGSLVSLMKDVYRTVCSTYKDSHFIAYSKGNQNRIVSPKDLMKWAGRVNSMLTQFGVTVDNIGGIATEVFEAVFCESLDCFAGSIRVVDAYIFVANAIGSAMNIAPHVVDFYLKSYIPELRETSSEIVIGRSKLNKFFSPSLRRRSKASDSTLFANTNHTLKLLEQIAKCVQMREPLLLVGETGTGKTTVVQRLASKIGCKLTVINLSQQTEASDLIGGYKPVDAKAIAIPLREEFELLFEGTFSSKKNERFNLIFNRCFSKGQWTNVIRLWNEAVKMARDVIENQRSRSDDQPRKKRRQESRSSEDLITSWNSFSQKVTAFESQYKRVTNSFVYQFIEGTLVRAVKNGDWVLLDEINLAAPDTLESIADLLVHGGEGAAIHLYEKGDTEAIRAHPNFRMFACMNPTDVGKKDLPPGFRSRFTELYVKSPDEDMRDLLTIIEKYIGALTVGSEGTDACEDVASLYMEAKKLAEGHQIVDGANQKPHFSIRTLSRMLLFVRDMTPAYGFRRALYEAFGMSFLTLLDRASEDILMPLIIKYTIGKLKNPKSVLSKIPSRPVKGNYIQFKHYWLEVGKLEPDEQPNYIITPFVEKNLLNLVRATATRRFPVLIQGPTSSGKTSMINYLAKRTGHKFVRINNHEHTDIQEYLGSYVSDDEGNLTFQEGLLVEAVRNGYWLVLDELNLAPTEVLEALNRLLDDNREILIPETQEVVKPHPHFLLFASQNPPGLYGGRKNLSRAFRNRFLELHFDDIPEDELEIILRGRCQIPPTYAKKIVEVYKELSVRRQSTRVFEKNGFATLRDLFRWANRDAVGYDQLALNGYLLLAERVRRPEERDVVKAVIEKVLRVKLDIELFYDNYAIQHNSNISTVWNKAMRRIYILVKESLRNNEPVLLVGETGCGKTTVCQILAEHFGKALYIVNAHQNTEASDIIGAQRPLRNRSELQKQLKIELQKVLSVMNIETVDEDLDALLKTYERLPDKQDIDASFVSRIDDLQKRLRVLFEWCDGSLIGAMRQGSFFLLDEISLTDDSVLERLNSVLEPERSLLLAEKGSKESSITASDGFQFLATMNPSGDYGKKELSPALRNRFTEIWVPAITNLDDIYQIVQSRLNQEDFDIFSKPMVLFATWFSESFGSAFDGQAIVSIRDILAWIDFLNATKGMDQYSRLLHGASMVFIDTLGTNTFAYLAESPEILATQKQKCIEYLSILAGSDLRSVYTKDITVQINQEFVSAGPFRIPRNSGLSSEFPFSFQAPTTAFNAMRIIRGMQLKKPIMLEGSPGVGKTSIMTALSAAAGAKLTRINLSDQTDLMDLFGSDSPVEGGKSGEFAWRDAPFLDAMQHGHWVLLDEMNLASQSVLEGLNACLDHRAEAYVPELDRTFSCHPDFKVFAAQNSHYQGGGRKGLPKSFINRFTVVYVDLLSSSDLHVITKHLYPDISQSIAQSVIKFISRLEVETSRTQTLGRVGGPWEFNLRDTVRWFQLLGKAQELCRSVSVEEYLDIIVKDRFRSNADKEAVNKLFSQCFGYEPSARNLSWQLSDIYLEVGHSILQRYTNHSRYEGSENLSMLQCNVSAMESLMTCVDMAWPAILCGPTNSGKSSLIRLLAKQIGVRLEEFAINSDIDSMDIVGGYDQIDIGRKSSKCWEKIRNFVLERLAGIDSNGIQYTIRLKNLLSSINEASVDYLKDAYDLLEQLQFYAHQEASDVISSILSDINTLNILARQYSQQAAIFEWFDGILVKAVEEGFWLVLDNANLCGASVLDRLNSLLEPNGFLVINERGMENGELKILKPHPNFRLFLTVNPLNGELSRAMRNRGIEIYLDDLNSRMTPVDRRLVCCGQHLERYIVSEAEETDLDVTEQMSGLTISKSLDNFLTREWIDSSNSFVRYFSSLIDIARCSAEYQDLDSLAVASLDYIPIVYRDYIGRWNTVLRDSLEFSESERALAETATKMFTELSITPIANDMMTLYRSTALGCSEKYYKYQSYYSLANPYALGYINTCVEESQIKIMHILYDITVRLLQMKEQCRRIETRARGSNRKKLNFIEKSALAYQTNVNTGVSFHIYALVVNIVLFVDNFLCVKAKFQASTEVLQSLYKICDIWNDFINLVNSNIVDESQFPIYNEMFLGHFSYMKDFVLATTELDPAKLQASIDSFGSLIKLRTGRLMDSLWNAMRPSLPITEEDWASYLNMIDILNSLDDVMLHVPMSRVAVFISMQQKLFDALVRSSKATTSLTLNNDLKKYVTGFIESLKNDNKLFARERMAWCNTAGFVLKCKELSGLLNEQEVDPGQKTLELGILANRKSASWLAYIERSPDSHLNDIPLLRSLFESNDYKDCLSDFFDGSILSSFISSTEYVHHGKISRILDTLEETRLFGKLFTEYSSEICTSKTLSLVKLLVKHIRLILGALDSTTEPHFDYDDLLCKLFAKDNAYATCLDNLLLYSKEKNIPFEGIVNVLGLLRTEIEKVNSNEDLDQISLGKAIVCYSRILINYYLPNVPYDPAIRPYVQKQCIDADLIRISSLLHASRTVEMVVSGNSSNSRISRLELEAESLSTSTVSMASYRPVHSRSSALFKEFQQFYNSFMVSDRMDTLISEILEGSSKSSPVAELFQKNTSQFLERIKRQFIHYTDLIAPLENYIYWMKIGVGLINNGTRNAKNRTIQEFLYLVDGTMLSGEYISDDILRSLQLLRSNNISQNIIRTTMFSCLRWIKLRTQAEVLVDETSLVAVNSILKALYYQWLLEQRHEDQEQRSKSTIYKAEQDDDDAEFKKLFPDYEDVVSSNDIQKRKSSSIEDYDFVFLIGDIFKDQTQDLKFNDAISSSWSLFGDLMKNGVSMATGDKYFVKVLPAFTMKLSTLTRDEAEIGNFYIDSNISEAEKISKLAYAILDRLKDLIDKWPENEILHDSFVICKDLLSFDIDSPVARFLPKVEDLLGSLHEWEKIASREFSVSRNINSLNSLIVEWRKLELKSWSHILDRELVQMRRNAAEFFFYLYENIIVNPIRLHESGENINEYMDELLQAITSFIGSSLKGQFSTRLDFLKFFKLYSQRLAELTPQLSIIPTALGNILELYELFTPLVDDSIAAHRKVIEKEVKDTILLASWKDINFLALKESARRSHYQLYKSIRKFRAVLSEPVKAILENGLGDSVLQQDLLTEMERISAMPDMAIAELLEKESLLITIDSWATRPERLVNMRSTALMFSKYQKDILSCEPPSLLLFARSLVETMRELRKETPQSRTKENESAIKFLKARKAKLLSDTLKDLKRMGLRFRVRSDIVNRQETVTKIFALLEESKWSAKDHYFFSFLEMLPQARSCIGGHNEDLTKTQVERSLGCIDSILNIVILERNNVLRSLKQLDDAKRSFKEMNVLCSFNLHNVSVAVDLRSGDIAILSSFLHRRLNMIEFALSVNQAHSQLSGCNNSVVVTLLDKWKSDTFTVLQKVGKYSNFNVLSFSTTAVVSLFNEVEELIQSQRIEGVECSNRDGSLRYILQLVDASHIHHQLKTTELKYDSSLSDFELSLRTLADSILVVVQSIREITSQLGAITTDDENWIVLSHNLRLRLLRALHISEISEVVLKCMHTINGMNLSDTVVCQTVGALCEFSKPILDSYFNLTYAVIENCYSDHSNMSKAGLILVKAFVSVAKSGFCSPQEQSEEEEGGAAQQGTGLGDGDGEESISNTVDKDEDLTDLANQPNESKEKDDRDDKDDADDAIEMDDDMAGETEEIDEKERNNSDNEDQEDEIDEIDEEIGDVDNLDPSAVDEKMWDDNAQEDLEERSANQPLDKSQVTDDLAAKSEDNKEEPQFENQDEQDKSDLEDDEHEDEMAQDDSVQQQDQQDIDSTIPESDVLDLPEDMNLDQGDEFENEDAESKLDDDNLPEDDPLDDPMPFTEKDKSNDTEKEGEDIEETESKMDESNQDEVKADDSEGGITGDELEEVEVKEDDEGNEEDASSDEMDIDEAELERSELNQESMQAEEEELQRENDDENLVSQSEGLRGPEDITDEADIDASAAKGADGKEDTGDDTNANKESDEQENSESGKQNVHNDANASVSREQDMDSEISPEQSHKELGNSNEEWHRPNQNIQGSDPELEEKDNDKSDSNFNEYRHLDENQATHDTQALGIAANDITQKIDDDSMAIDDTNEKNEEDVINEENVAEIENVAEDPVAGRQIAGSMVGERNVDNDFLTSSQYIDSEMQDTEGDSLPITTSLQVGDDMSLAYRSLDEARQLWQEHERATQDLSSALCEQLRLVLEPTLTTKLKGDFRTGKRLNMKRIIPYIASQYKKDKIWLRRTKPSKREYQIMIALDDSKSMSESKCVELAFDTLALVSKALERLESGQISIVRFGESCEVVHPFQKPFTSEAGVNVFQWFGFNQTRTDVSALVQRSIALFEEATGSSKRSDLWRLEIIISDGLCEDHLSLRRLVRQAREHKIMLVFVIIDGITKGASSAGINDSSSILDLSQVTYETDESGSMKLKVTKYLSSFPFEFYVIVRNISELPSVLSIVLRQYFSEVADVQESF
ncbi:hypothetical protein V1511DRAFT_320492 [Dipodascopsis uninucleata]